MVIPKNRPGCLVRIDDVEMQVYSMLVFRFYSVLRYCMFVNIFKNRVNYRQYVYLC